tara:strand:+ start:9208 stop:10557 length:1350 start_codon:yes stop_codon:yes gene_type:complete
MALDATPTYSIEPSSKKTPLKTNYISLFDYSSQYKPETHDKIAKIYGQQSISGMLYMLGAESAMASDKYIWTEEGRLHTVYNDVARSTNVFTKTAHVFREGETVHLSSGSVKRRGVISAVDANTFTVAAYKSAGFTALAATNVTAFVDGSEFGKGTTGMVGSLSTDFTILDNKPIILKDKFEVNGSDTAQITWVQTDEGGYLWFLQDQVDTRRRWEDRLELGLVNGEAADAGSDAEANGTTGTEGLFEAIRKRGNSFTGVADDISEWDTILKRFDAQGKIQDYMFYVNRDQSLAIDNMLGDLNAGYDGGISYGIFDNDKDMSVNLGFKGFTRGSYNFFKSDWKLLNEQTLLGAVAEAARTNGVLIPVGTKEVYEGEYNGSGAGSKITTPFLQCMYRASKADNRKYKTWLTGNIFGVHTDDDDVMRENHLSERMLNTVGANNFMIFEGTV